jgi:thiol-disulfide isomerase/thioredoxin
MLDELCAIIGVTCWLFGSTVLESQAQEVEAKSYPVLSGVGLALNAKDGRIFAAKVLPKSPADVSGLIHAGDRLVSVEIRGKKALLDGKTVGETASLLRGPVGTELVLTVMRSEDGETVRVPLKREPLEIAGVSDATYKAFIGKPAPNLKLTSLDGSEARQITDYRGRIVVLDFWASWCPTCYAPVSKMQSMLAKNPRWKGEVELITVTVDSDLSKAVDVIDKHKWNNTQNRAVDVEKLNAAGIRVIPLVVIIGRDGTIVAMADAHALDIEHEVAALLAK